MSFRLEQLQLFLMVAEQGSFTAVADAEQIPQPTISRHIKQLEEELGLRLFERKQRQVSLSQFGQQFIPYAKQVIQSVEAAQLFAENRNATLSGTLDVEMPVGLMIILSESFLPKFTATYPEIRLRFHSIGIDKWHLPLRGDIRLHPHLPREEQLIVQRFLTLRYDFLASPAYVDAHGPIAHPTELQGQTCILMREGEQVIDEWQYRENGRERSVKVRGGLEFDNSLSAIAAASRGLGVIWTADLRRYATHKGRLEVLFEGRFGSESTLYAIYRSRELQLPRERVFIEALLEHFQQH